MSDKHANIPELLFAPTRSRDRGDNEAKCPFRFPAWSKHLETCHNGSEKIIKDHERNHFGAEFIPSNLRVTKRITYYIYIYIHVTCPEISREKWSAHLEAHGSHGLVDTPKDLETDRKDPQTNQTDILIHYAGLCQRMKLHHIVSHYHIQQRAIPIQYEQTNRLSRATTSMYK